MSAVKTITSSAILSLLLVSPRCLRAEGQASTTLISTLQPAGTIPTSLANEVDAAVDRGLRWLAAQQKENGSWSDGNFPALTALAMRAFLKGPHPRKAEITESAVRYVLSCVQPDGGIYRNVEGRKGGGLSNYNTAICMAALHEVGRADLVPVVLNARKFVAGAQYLGDDDYRGGFGYDRATGRAYTDLMNTYYSVQAMRATQGVEDLRGKDEKRVDIDWGETVKFIERMQNKPGSGEENAGGFFYNPSDPKAGTSTNRAGVVVFRSYGSITYSGLLALVYANVSREDARVASAFDWASRHWSLQENPGMGANSLYFFYHVLTKALNAYGAAVVPVKDGSPINWKEEVARKLVSLQKIDAEGRGYWMNEVSRYWEGDPVLTTAYTLLALETLQP